MVPPQDPQPVPFGYLFDPAMDRRGGYQAPQPSGSPILNETEEDRLRGFFEQPDDPTFYQEQTMAFTPYFQDMNVGNTDFGDLQQDWQYDITTSTAQEQSTTGPGLSISNCGPNQFGYNHGLQQMSNSGGNVAHNIQYAGDSRLARDGANVLLDLSNSTRPHAHPAPFMIQPSIPSHMPATTRHASTAYHEISLNQTHQTQNPYGLQHAMQQESMSPQAHQGSFREAHYPSSHDYGLPFGTDHHLLLGIKTQPAQMSAEERFLTNNVSDFGGFFEGVKESAGPSPRTGKASQHSQADHLPSVQPKVKQKTTSRPTPSKRQRTQSFAHSTRQHSPADSTSISSNGRDGPSGDTTLSSSPPAQPHGKKSARRRRSSGAATSSGGISKRQKLSDDQKKQNHILSEQRRRDTMNNNFDELVSLVPSLQTGNPPKSQKLQEAIRYLQTVINGNARAERVIQERQVGNGRV